MFDFYTRGISWYAYSEHERWIMNRTIRVFRKNLIDAGFFYPTRSIRAGKIVAYRATSGPAQVISRAAASRKAPQEPGST